MDPFSAIGFASNILSFVDFGWTLIREARAIYDSTSGITSSDKSVKAIAQDVHRLCVAIVASSPTGADELRELAEECQAVADDLLALMRKLTLPRDTPKRLKMYRSLVLASRRNLKKGELDAISARLQKLQLQLVMGMQWLLR